MEDAAGKGGAGGRRLRGLAVVREYGGTPSAKRIQKSEKIENLTCCRFRGKSEIPPRIQKVKKASGFRPRHMEVKLKSTGPAPPMEAA